MHHGTALFLLSLSALGHPVIAQEAQAPVVARAIAAWQSRAVRETSGLAVSRRHLGIVWVHNDSGDGPFVYAADTAGSLHAAFEVTGARAVDWEDIALGPCPAHRWADRACLYIADTGDNDERRKRVVLYAVPEPDDIPSGATTPASTEDALALRLRYPDRPHDAEALAVLPDGRIELVTKGRSGPILRFEIGPEAWRARDLDLGVADTLPLTPSFVAGRWVTGAAADPDGLHVLVRTYTEVYRFRLGARWTLAGPPCRMGLIEDQGEAIDVTPAGDMILGSEGTRGRTGGLTLLRCDWD